jgi:hypothetical protein
MKDYQAQTGKKFNHGLTITSVFKDWIKNNPKISENGKQKTLEYCNNFEFEMKKAAEGCIIFSDESLTKISNYFKKKFDITISRDTIGRFAKKILSKKEYLKRFPIDQEKCTRDIELIIQDLIQNTKFSQRQIAKILMELRVPVSRRVVRRIVKKILKAEEIKKKYPAHARYTEAQEDDFPRKNFQKNIMNDLLHRINTQNLKK